MQQRIFHRSFYALRYHVTFSTFANQPNRTVRKANDNRHPLATRIEFKHLQNLIVSLLTCDIQSVRIVLRLAINHAEPDPGKFLISFDSMSTRCTSELSFLAVEIVNEPIVVPAAGFNECFFIGTGALIIETIILDLGFFVGVVIRPVLADPHRMT